MDITQRTVALSFGMLFSFADAFSQNGDSPGTSRRVETYAADKFAVTRPFNIEYTYSAPCNYTAEREGKPLPESRITGFSQLKVSSSFNFIKKSRWLLGASAGYRFTAVKADVTDASTAGVNPIDKDFHYFYSSLNFTYFSTLFNKRTVYTSSILLDGSEKHVERVRGLLTGTVILKASQRTKLGVGILVNIDPTIQTPVLPIFSYEHRFDNGLLADIAFPRNVYLRKPVFGNGRVSLGAELDRTSFYLYDIDGTSQRYEYRQMDIKSGLTYEHLIAKYFVLTAKTGMKLTTTGRLFRKEDSFNDYVLKTSPDPTFYFNIGVSFNPFSVIGKKK
ncbi:DUF6268 family outer membrane beta-barrel protein [uncultured Chitinophaga sp.]|jgi:hypothetical protein|uniref:DUF6268 family outer membrane beta-barrel protein n=1 Tax=uncultured Chitinophaga sp. TaxID=339340 RepID=UPI00263A3C3F|nr:DUF6268 family outer membrane beta-barrel protein [uncultured Chitinophaga sp.]